MDISEKLNIPEGLHGFSLVKKAVKELRFQIWLRDIPSPGEVPEYIEHHQSITEILSFTDDVLEIINKEIARKESIMRYLDVFGVRYADTDDMPDPREVDNAGL